MAFAIGAGEDAVTLTLNGSDVKVAESYEVKMAMLEGPNAFTLRLGNGATAASMLQAYPKGTPFTLSIGGRPQFAGKIEATRAEGNSGATEVVFRGRDWLATLVDDEITDVKSYVDVSYADLVTKQLQEVGLGDRLVYADNLACRKIRSGVGVTSISEPAKTDSPTVSTSGRVTTIKSYDKFGNEVPNSTNQFGTDIPVKVALTTDLDGKPISRSITVGGVTSTTRFATSITVNGKVVRGALAGSLPGSAAARRTQVSCVAGETRIHFLRKNLDHAGLILWAADDGNFVVGQPNTQQPALFKFVRQRGNASNVVNITGSEFDDDASKQFSTCIVHGRGGGKKFGRAKVKGQFVNLDTYQAGTIQRRVFRDTNVISEADATFYARRKMAEGARAGWMLSYTFSGHTAPTLLPGNPRAVITMDTMCEVQDDELGISGLFYIESVTYSQGSDGTVTKARLMRPDDLVFGVDE